MISMKQNYRKICRKSLNAALILKSQFNKRVEVHKEKSAAKGETNCVAKREMCVCMLAVWKYLFSSSTSTSVKPRLAEKKNRNKICHFGMFPRNFLFYHVLREK